MALRSIEWRVAREASRAVFTLAVPVLAVLLMLSRTTSAEAQNSAMQRQPIVIRGGHLFTGTGDAVIPNRGILIVAGRLMAVDRPITASEMAGARIIDLRETEYVLPGLFDVHAHYNMTLGPRGIRTDEWQYNPLIFLANGVTSTFPAGEYEPDSMRVTRERIDAGEQIGPRIYNSGPYFGTARPGWNRNATTADIYRDVDYWIDERQFFTPEVQAWVKSQPPRKDVPSWDSLYWAMRRTTKAFYDAGGLLTLGTDNPSRGEFLAGFSAHRELREKAKQLDPDATLRKPFELRELQGVMERLISRVPAA